MNRMAEEMLSKNDWSQNAKSVLPELKTRFRVFIGA